MYIELQHINKTFGDYKASDDVTFGIEKGKLIALLGPSGSGKTTILRMLAGLEHQDSGDIYINGKLVNGLPTNERGIGFVFQNYALFPYLNVYNNIAYGLKVQKKDKAFIKQRVTELLELVGLPGLEKRYPDQLSGGQRQRIALARALAPQPELLLLDEPFAAIDAKVRKELRTWLRETIDKIGITSIFVTHDQDEAVEVADEIIVTNLGRVEQVGTPEEIYLNPATPFVAKFIGQSAVIDSVASLKGFGDVDKGRQAIIRPEYVDIITEEESSSENDSVLENGVIEEILFRGNSYEVRTRVHDITITGNVPLSEKKIRKGDKVKVFVKKLCLLGDSSTEMVTNKALDSSGLYYI